ncbi:sulfite exporter TauE/SafE family protein [Planctomycetota bacterium]
MDVLDIVIVCLTSFIVSIIGVTTGGTSLIIFPLLVWLGMGPKNAIATNMFALIFLSLSGAIGFRKEIKPHYYKMIAFLSILTICGSLIGANFVLAIDENILRRIIAIMMCIIACSLLFGKNLGIRETDKEISKIKFLVGSLLVLILGVYGGFFSGGYVTLLTSVLILSFGLNFLQVALITKVFNVFSSFVACAFFYYHNLIDFPTALPLAASMSLGAFFGARLAVTKGNLWVRNLFIIAVIILAIKLLVF